MELRELGMEIPFRHCEDIKKQFGGSSSDEATDDVFCLRVCSTTAQKLIQIKIKSSEDILPEITQPHIRFVIK